MPNDKACQTQNEGFWLQILSLGDSIVFLCHLLPKENLGERWGMLKIYFQVNLLKVSTVGTGVG